ncbi:GtrA family protein [Thiohalocapsa marina]|nr:GtrA family protein [Thiohalocapsa marina]
MAKRFMRFASTGVFVTFLHAITAELTITNHVFRPPVANGVAFVVATIASYYINTAWSFSGAFRVDTLIRFTVVTTIGFMVAMAVATVVDNMGASHRWGIFAVAVTLPPLTFLLHFFWTYRQLSQPTDRILNRRIRLPGRRF